MTEIQFVATLLGSGLVLLTGSQFFVYYRLGRMEQRIIDTINGKARCDEEEKSDE